MYYDIFPAYITLDGSLMNCSKPGSTESRAKRVQAVQSNNAQGDWDRLLQTDRTGNGRTAKDNGGEETELNAIGQVVLDAVTAESICL